MITKKQAVVLLAIVALLALAAYVVYDTLSPRPVGSDSVVAPASPITLREPEVKVPIKKPVKVYKGQTKARLKLPASVQADEKQQVIAASQVKSDLRPQTVSTVINTDTGAVETYVKTDPYPWFAVETRGEARIAYGYKLNAATHAMAPVARLQVGYDVVRVKALTAGVLASLDSDGATFVGVGVSYRW